MIDQRAQAIYRKNLARRAKRRRIRAVRRCKYNFDGPVHAADHTKAVR